MRIGEQILAAEAELEEKDQELVLFVPRRERSHSDTPARHRRYQEESPESTENSSENISQGNIETLKTEIFEVKGRKSKTLTRASFTP